MVRALRLEPLEPRLLLSVTTVETKLLPSEPRANFYAGADVAVNDDYALVGESASVESRVSAAFVYDVDTGEELFRLRPSDTANMEAYGYGVALDGHIAIVGDPEAGSGDYGAAHLFDLRTGQELHKLTANDAQAESDFGYTVEIEGNLAVVGAAWQDGTGAAYLFDVTTGSQLAKIRHADARNGDHIHALSLEGNILAIGSAQWYSGGNGAVYLYDLSIPTAPVQLAKIVAPDAQRGDQFGSGASISGTKLVVGAVWDDDRGTDSGSAYVFDISNPRAPSFCSKLVPDAFAGVGFGSSVGAYGDLALIGALQGTNESGVPTGSAYVFDIADPYAPTLLTKLTPSDGQANDTFGATALFGQLALVGSGGYDGQGVSNSGAAYLYRIHPAVSPNHAPTFAAGSNQVLDEDAGPQVVTGWATEISPGPDEESNQSVWFEVANDNSALFSQQPWVSPDGTLTYTPAANAHGSAQVTVVLHDDGGTENGGVDTSEPQTFTIVVNSVIDAVIDVKPGSDVNPINLGSKGVLPIAILSTQVWAGEIDDFDATKVDVTTIKLNGVAIDPAHAAFEDIDGDGDLDLILHFSMEEIWNHGVLDENSVDLLLSADFDGGNAFGPDLSGSDAVTIVPPKGKGKSGK